VVGVTAEPISDEKRRQTQERAKALAREAPGRAPGQVIVHTPDVECQVRLKERAAGRALDISIGGSEAQAIALALHGAVQPRPMTDDFIVNLFQGLDDVSVLRVVITKQETADTAPIDPATTPASPPRGTFYAALELRDGERLVSVDCRPSDGIAAAVRLGVPIVAADELEPAFAAA